METNQYMDMFLDESHEHLQSLNDGLLGLEDNAEDLSILNEIFRNAHTLKGMSATMGYNKIAELTHEMEDVLDMLRKEQLKINSDIIDTLFKCVDSLTPKILSMYRIWLQNWVQSCAAKVHPLPRRRPPQHLRQLPPRRQLPRRPSQKLPA